MNLDSRSVQDHGHPTLPLPLEHVSKILHTRGHASGAGEPPAVVVGYTGIQCTLHHPSTAKLEGSTPLSAPMPAEVCTACCTT